MVSVGGGGLCSGGTGKSRGSVHQCMAVGRKKKKLVKIDLNLSSLNLSTSLSLYSPNNLTPRQTRNATTHRIAIFSFTSRLLYPIPSPD